MPPSANAADEKSVREKQRTDKEKREQEQAELKELLQLPAFRRYVWRHINVTCGLLKSASSPNGSVQSQNIGMQDVGRILWIEIEGIDPLLIPQIMTEYHEAQK